MSMPVPAPPGVAVALSPDEIRAQKWVLERARSIHAPTHIPPLYVRCAMTTTAVAEIACRTNEFKPGVRIDIWWKNSVSNECAIHGCPAALPAFNGKPDDFAIVPAQRRLLNRGGTYYDMGKNVYVIAPTLGYWPGKQTVVVPSVEVLRLKYP